MPEKYSPNKTISLLKCKCPRCQSGNIFKFGAYNLSKFTEMNDVCPVCKLRFEIEPGFFWGAMYVSYVITTGMFLILGTLTYLIGNNPDFWAYMFVICGTVIFTSPMVYRYSRALMLYVFSPIHFDKSFSQK